MRWAITISSRQISVQAVLGNLLDLECADRSCNMRWPAGLQFPSRHIGKDRTDDVTASVSDTPKPEHSSVVCVEPRSARTETRWRVTECRNRNSRRQLAVGSIQ